jgi:hypothetical protein
MLLHHDAENQRQALEDELEFLKQLHEQVGNVFYVFAVALVTHQLTSITTLHRPALIAAGTRFGATD